MLMVAIFIGGFVSGMFFERSKLISALAGVITFLLVAGIIQINFLGV